MFKPVLLKKQKIKSVVDGISTELLLRVPVDQQLTKFQLPAGGVVNSVALTEK